ncbi:MAG: N-6 DNA methylase [Flavobacteriales bacterium]|nr:N-6 DNA methylase [Flavobacteriales bacterium]
MEKTLELLIPSGDRSINGAFFTPDLIVDHIVGEITPKDDGTYLDPSCGCGAFLIGLLEALHKASDKPLRTLIRENIFGADILGYNVRRSKVILALHALMHGETIEESDFNIHECDSLKHDWNMAFDGIVGNPPYVKFQDLSDANRMELEANWSSIKGGTFNLYFAFFELGIRLLKPATADRPGGMLGYITPNNYFTSLAGESLRSYLQHGRHVRKVLDFGHRRVFDAQTYTAITFLTKAPQDAVLFDRIAEDQAIGDFLARHTENRNPVANLDPRKWRLLKEADMHNIRRIERAGTAIGSMFDIVVGIATLKDNVYFVTGYEEDGDHLRITKDGGAWTIEKAITRPVYKISEMKGANDISRNRRRIICPYYTDRKTATAIPEDVMECDFPGCLDYLRAHRAVLQERDKGKVAYTPFYAWGRTQGLTRRGLKLIVPTFSKAPRFLRVADEDAFFTNGYGIHLRQQDPGFLGHANPLLHEENLDVTARILNSAVMDYYVRMTSVYIQGGYPCYQKNFIERFSLPELTDDDVDAMRRADDAAFPSMLWDAYGLDRAVMEAFLVDREQVAGEAVPAEA